MNDTLKTQTRHQLEENCRTQAAIIGELKPHVLWCNDCDISNTGPETCQFCRANSFTDTPMEKPYGFNSKQIPNVTNPGAWTVNDDDG